MSKKYIWFWFAALSGFGLSLVWFRNPEVLASANFELLALASSLPLFVGALWVCGKQTTLPVTSLVGLGFALLIFLQSKGVSYAFPLQFLLPLMYVLFAALLAWAFQNYWQVLGGETYARHLAWCVTLAGVVAALLGWSQLLGVTIQIDDRAYYLINGSGALIGPLGQPNLYASALVLGLVAWIYLAASRRIPAWFRVLPALVFGVPLFFTASRTGFLELLVLAGLAFYGWRICKQSDEYGKTFCRELFGLSVLCLLIQIFCSWIVSNGTLDIANPSLGRVSALVRMGQSNSDRFDMWQRAWAIFCAHPFWGSGFGNYALMEYVELAGRINNPHSVPIVAHSHNLILQILAEAGVFGGVCVLLLGWCWLKTWRTAFSNPAVLLLQLLSLVILLHSQLEYPLWYANFLAIFMACSVNWSLSKAPVISRGLMATVFLLLLAFFTAGGSLFIFGLYRTDQALALKQQQHFGPSSQLAISVIQGNGLAAPYAAHLLMGMAEPGDSDETNQVYKSMAERLARWQPSATVLYRLALWQYSVGESDQALETLRKLLVAYPSSREWLLKSQGAQSVLLAGEKRRAFELWAKQVLSVNSAGNNH